MSEQESEPSEGVRISDRRRIDPVTLQARHPEPAGEAPPAPGDPVAADPVAPQPESDPVAEANAKAEEALADVKRIAAEYANYRRRVDRDRDLQRDVAIGTVITDLLPILDDVQRAREHGELAGGFKSVGESVEAVAAKFGVERFGEAGTPFDPAEHEAMTSEHSDEVEEPTVTAVYQVGYRLRGRLLRPARVAVADNG